MLGFVFEQGSTLWSDSLKTEFSVIFVVLQNFNDCHCHKAIYIEKYINSRYKSFTLYYTRIPNEHNDNGDVTNRQVKTDAILMQFNILTEAKK